MMACEKRTNFTPPTQSTTTTTTTGVAIPMGAINPTGVINTFPSNINNNGCSSPGIKINNNCDIPSPKTNSYSPEQQQQQSSSSSIQSLQPQQQMSLRIHHSSFFAGKVATISIEIYYKHSIYYNIYACIYT